MLFLLKRECVVFFYISSSIGKPVKAHLKEEEEIWENFLFFCAPLATTTSEDRRRFFIADYFAVYDFCCNFAAAKQTIYTA